MLDLTLGQTRPIFTTYLGILFNARLVPEGEKTPQSEAGHVRQDNPLRFVNSAKGRINFLQTTGVRKNGGGKAMLADCGRGC